MIDITVGGVCSSCNRYSPGLYTCKVCGSRCCPLCVDIKTGFCRLCGGVKKVKR